MAYPTLTDFSPGGAYPLPLNPALISTIESESPGYTNSRIAIQIGKMEARLGKRYDLGQIAASPPLIVIGWLQATVTIDLLDFRGRNPSDPAAVSAKERYDLAIEEMREAADAKDGLFELPLVPAGQSAVKGPKVLFYTENSPYISADMQEAIGIHEDFGGKNGRCC